MSAPRCVLLDRDGVLSVDLPTGVRALDQLRLEPGAAAAAARFTAAGWRVLVVTNQSAVGRGSLAADELDRINAAVAGAVAEAGGRIDGWYVCPHHPELGCDCRKPKPGLIERARAEWGFEPAVTTLVGDAVRDAEAALAAGCRPLLVGTGKGAASRAARPDLPAVADLAAAADLLLGGTA